MGGEVRAAREMRLECGYVIGLLALPLELAVIHHRSVARHHLRHGVREVGGLAQAHVALHHCRLAPGLCHDEITRMGDPRRAVGGAHEDQVDGLLQNLSAGKIDESTILDECGVQGHEGVVLELGMPAEVRLEAIRFFHQGGGEDHDPHSVRNGSQAGSRSTPLPGTRR